MTQCKWCDFIVYTSKGMSIERERIPYIYDHGYWVSMKNKLKNYYFDHFISTAAAEFLYTINQEITLHWFISSITSWQVVIMKKEFCI